MDTCMDGGGCDGAPEPAMLGCMDPGLALYAYAEVRYGDVVLMVASADADHDVPALRGQSVGGGLYLCLATAAEVDAWHARAVDAGGQDVFPHEDTEWGTRRARVLDPEGHESYRPGSNR